MKTLVAMIAILAVFSSQNQAHGEDVYDFSLGRLSVKLDKKVNEENNYASYKKTLPLERYGASVEVIVRINEDEDYYTIVFVTRGVDLGGTGIGNAGPLLPYCSDWDLRKKTQAIYASGTGLDGALADLEAKFNGANGNSSFTGTGDATRGELVITLLGPFGEDANGELIRRTRNRR